jgi:hypothetical protein
MSIGSVTVAVEGSRPPMMSQNVLKVRVLEAAVVFLKVCVAAAETVLAIPRMESRDW